MNEIKLEDTTLVLKPVEKPDGLVECPSVDCFTCIAGAFVLKTYTVKDSLSGKLIDLRADYVDEKNAQLFKLDDRFFLEVIDTARFNHIFDLIDRLQNENRSQEIPSGFYEIHGFEPEVTQV